MGDSKTVHLVIGTRPNIIKTPPVYRALTKRDIDVRLVYTGQHTDPEMSVDLMRQLELSEPDIQLELDQQEPAARFSELMQKYGAVLSQQKPGLVIVIGDVDSTLACALTADLNAVPVAHVEAGLRSFNKEMPEERNRILTDHCSTIVFAPHEKAVRQLIKEDIDSERIHNTGNVLFDAVDQISDKVRFDGETDQPYCLMTAHRPHNVDEKSSIEKLTALIKKLAGQFEIRFPVHPRTRQKFIEYNLWEVLQAYDGIRLLDPLPYIEFLGMMKNAALMVTDSGGIQVEASALHIPCLTIRDETEHMETIVNGSNLLAGYMDSFRLDKLDEYIDEVMHKRSEDQLKTGASERIAGIVEDFFNQEKYIGVKR